MFPLTWQEYWSNAHAGHSIQDKPWETPISYIQNFHSLNERLKVEAVIVVA